MWREAKCIGKKTRNKHKETCNHVINDVKWKDIVASISIEFSVFISSSIRSSSLSLPLSISVYLFIKNIFISFIYILMNLFLLVRGFPSSIHTLYQKKYWIRIAISHPIFTRCKKKCNEIYKKRSQYIFFSFIFMRTDKLFSLFEVLSCLFSP